MLLRRTRLLYSISGLGSEALNQSRNVWLIFFYAPPDDIAREPLLKLTTISVLLTAGRLLEAFDDVLIGWWSDRTRSRWGRRIPFVVLGAPAWAAAGFLTFVPPQESSQAAIAIYFFIVLQLFHLFSTLTSGPYDALFPEVARTSNERIALASTRVYFGLAGAAVGLVGSGLLVDQFGFRWMAGSMAMLVIVTRYIGIASVWNTARRSRSAAVIPLGRAIRTTFASRPLRAFLPSMLAYQLGLALLIGVLPYFVTATYRTDEPGGWVAVLTAVALTSMAATIPIFARYARRTSKQAGYRAGMLASACAFPTVFVAGHLPGIPDSAEAMIMMAIVGSPVAAVFLFSGPIIADICDEDARTTGMRREATFFGGQVFAEKTVGSLAPLLLGLVLILGSTATDPLGIRLIGPLAGLLVFAGFLSFRAYDLPDEIAPSTQSS